MTLKPAELSFLSAWAREEWEPECYQAPAHRLQLSHGVSGGLLIEFIKAWTKAEGKKDHELLDVDADSAPRWPWSSVEEFHNRLEEIRNVNVEQDANA